MLCTFSVIFFLSIINNLNFKSGVKGFEDIEIRIPDDEIYIQESLRRKSKKSIDASGNGSIMVI